MSERQQEFAVREERESTQEAGDEGLSEAKHSDEEKDKPRQNDGQTSEKEELADESDSYDDKLCQKSRDRDWKLQQA